MIEESVNTVRIVLLYVPNIFVIKFFSVDNNDREGETGRL